MNGEPLGAGSLTGARFPDMPAGYESYYLRACHPDGGLGVWIRYTAHRRPGAQPTGALWFTLFEESGPTATKVSGPPVVADWIRIGDAALGPGRAHGSAHGPAHDVAWDLRFSGAAPLCHLPFGPLYRVPVPRTKPVSLHPVARFDGSITVGGRDIEVSAWPGMVGHNWGAQHAERWIWLHGMGFLGAGDTTWLDLTFGRIRIGGRVTPWVANGAIAIRGERIRLGGLTRDRRPRIEESPAHLWFAVPGKEIVVAGTAEAPRERVVGWVYADPDGSDHHTANCSVADLTIRVARPGLPALNLRAPGLAAYELGMRERDHGIPIQPFPDG
ncbi:MAG TPA: hypothetical protein VH969_12840 [Actinophytocola sp.]|uniref:hypothetical protein n=1 Tax=Actinophytocola sp. TaxID=1872138 RepID=UPI002F94FC90